MVDFSGHQKLKAPLKYTKYQKASNDLKLPKDPGYVCQKGVKES